MWPDQVSNPGPLTYVSGALPTALRGPVLPSSVVFGYPLGDNQTLHWKDFVCLFHCCFTSTVNI